MQIQDVTRFLEQFAPPELAEPWDNVGLLLGDPKATLERVMTCLTLSPDVASEAIREGVELIVTHHPILFRPIQRLTTDTVEGAMLLRLAKAGTAVYSPHTALDSAAGGINARLCSRLGLKRVQPLRPMAVTERDPDGTPIGSGRWGVLEQPVEFPSFVARIRAEFRLPALDVVPTSTAVSKVAVACGSAAEYLSDALRNGCNLLITGEARFHSALEARSLGIGLVLLGHYASERFAVEELAGVLQEQFPSLTVWPSRDERDPLQRL